MRGPSIRRRLLVSITGIVLLMGAIMILMNGTLLEEYYIFMEKRMLTSQAAKVASIVDSSADDSGLSDLLEGTERKYSLAVSIIGADGIPRYFTRTGVMDQPFGGRIPDDKPSPAQRIPNFSVQDSTKLPDGSILELQNDIRLGVRYMTVKKQLSDGSWLDVRVMLSSIERGASVANTFTLYAVALGLIITVIWAVGFSRKFTEPLVEMSGIAHDISALDFSRKCETRQQDEMGQLGSSINELSEKLSAALEDLKLKNRMLEGELERERQLDSLRKEFVANVSHELRTPISVIQGYAEALKMNIAGDEGKKEYYSGVIVDEAERMNKLVSDLLELSQYQSGGAKLDMKRFSLTELVNRIADRCVRPELRPNLKLYLPEKAESFADERRTEQVLINFLNNASEHLSEGGRIDVMVYGEEGEPWVLEVVNDGEPIPEEAIGHIWDSFYRADKARSRNQGRYGLGLSIVRAIQEMHGMGYGAENLDGKVRFWAEVAKAENAKAGSTGAEAVDGGTEAKPGESTPMGA